MKVLINYADDRTFDFSLKQRLNSKTGEVLGNFDKVVSYSPKDIDSKFYEKNRHILNQEKGAGYWLWKPYFIRKTLLSLNDGDYLSYADSSTYFIREIDFLVKLMETREIDIACGMLDYPEKKYTKRDAFVLMNLDRPEYADSAQITATFHIWKKSEKSLKIVEEWMEYCQDERVLTDIPNQCGLANYGKFKNHRHDQSIFSLLIKKYRIEPISSLVLYTIDERSKEKSTIDWFRTFIPRSVIHINRKPSFYFLEAAFLLLLILQKGKLFKMFSVLFLILKRRIQNPPV